MSTQRSVAQEVADAELASFAEDVQYYLSLTPKQLPSRYLYDAAGSALFEDICRLPWYRITRTEQRLLEQCRTEIFASAGPVSTLVELGPGSGRKLATLIGAIPPFRGDIHLIDISSTALDQAHQTLASTDVRTVAHRGTYEQGLMTFAHAPRSGRTLALFLGSNIGNYDPPGADALLRMIRSALAPGDTLLLGADLVKPEEELLLAYDDPLGITAKFNLNLLVRANRELGSDFDLAGFSHLAVWNADWSRIEMHLVSRVAQRVRIPSAALEIAFKPGETIWTESSYKYSVPQIGTLLDRANFRVVSQWVDEGYALTLGAAV
jgi:dimethylhistidine N-methyltransferase